MNLLKSLAKVSLIIIFSRVLGFFRDLVLAKVFGVGIATDAFFIAFKLSNVLRHAFSEGSLSQIFLPIFTEYKNKKKNGDIRMFISYVFGLFILILTIITIIGILMAPEIIMVITPGFSDTFDKFNIASQLLRRILLCILPISLASLFGVILTTWNFFLIPVLAPVFLNISMIYFTFFIASYFDPPILALSYSVIIGSILQLIFQLPFLKKINMLVLPRINFHNIDIIRVIKQMRKMILSNLVNQISLILNTIFSSFLISGSISWMYYAERLIEFPAGILGVALGTILLPSLSEHFINGNHKEYNLLIDWGIRLGLLLSLPSAAALCILSKPVIISFFQYGKFTIEDTLMTQKALVTYSIGLIGSIIVKVLSPIFYSRQDIKTPVIITIVTLIFTQIMNLIFTKLLQHAGLSLSVSLATCLQAILLYWKLREQNIFIPHSCWMNFLIRLIIAVVVMSIVLLGILQTISDWSFGDMLHRLVRLFSVVTIGTITYFFTLFLLGVRLKEFNRHTTI